MPTWKRDLKMMSDNELCHSCGMMRTASMKWLMN